MTKDVKPDRPVHNPPFVSDLRTVESHKVLDNKGEAHACKGIYGGPDSTKQVLVIFISSAGKLIERRDMIWHCSYSFKDWSSWVE